MNTSAAEHWVSSTTSRTQLGPALARYVEKSHSAGMQNKAPSVQYINTALKTNGAITSLLNEIAGSGPRPLRIAQSTDNGAYRREGQRVEHHSPLQARHMPREGTTERSATGRPAVNVSNQSAIMTERDARSRDGADDEVDDDDEVENLKSSESEEPRFWEAFSKYHQSGTNSVSSSEGDDGHLSDASASKDSVMVAALDSNDSMLHASTSNSDSTIAHPSLIVRLQIASWSKRANEIEYAKPPILTGSATVPRITTTQLLVAKRPIRPKSTNQFSEEEEHLLIFLKEVKRLKWKNITSEFQKYYPSREYTILQSRYSTSINKRNRDEDPTTLKLPAEWAGEATIDWPAVRADMSKPSRSAETGSLGRGAGQVSNRPSSTSSTSKPRMIRQLTDNDYSSGGEIGMHVGRPRRAPPVNYDVRRRNRRLADDMNEMDLDDGNIEEPSVIDTSARSDSPSHIQPEVPAKAHVVINPPLELTHEAHDAAIALRCRDPKGEKLPYLAVAERLSLQDAPSSWEWNQLASRNWQGMLVHVDFSPVEAARVERALVKDQKRTQKTRHSTQRRQLRSILRSMTGPQLSRLANDLQRCLPAREKISIIAFLHDAKAGILPESPHILRLSAARPQKSMATNSNESTSSILRHRELGVQSRRGWRAASRALAYPVKNKIVDTLGPSSYWTGASSDIHTLAWSPRGEHFAAGAVAVIDQDSMQYNRPNNLLFGSLIKDEIHELAEHRIARPKTESGANSSHAMLASQDPKLYTTITSVAFSPSGRLMYSAGYDNSLCIWDLLWSESSQPELATKLRHKAPVEMMVVNQQHDGVLATADKKAERPIKVIQVEEEDLITQYEKPEMTSLQSEKAASRPDLNILPQALRFEPRTGRYLLAGFGANVRDDSGFDTSGDLCMWDLETKSQLSIVGANRNVFDVAFNPNQRSMPLFAAGCVAGSNVNRGMRSVIRLYDQHTMDRYSCPLEIECRALDMNDLLWCPQDEHLIAAGCTDGRVYVWDLRKADDPLRVLSHGPSLMPLQDGIHHERTDTGIRLLSWGDNATRLYSGSSDGVVKVWDVTRSVDDTFIKDLITTDSGIMAGAFSPDFSKLLLGEVNGAVNVLEVGRDDCTIKDADKLQYVPYHGPHGIHNEHYSTVPESGVAEGDGLLLSEELQVVPIGNLPLRQVVQGPNYAGPFDRSVDAPALRQQALEFQLSMTTTSGTPCNIPSCKDNLVKVTSEEFGDSGRSLDRIPDQLRKQWLKEDAATGIVPGKAKCTHCSRPALPSVADSDAAAVTLCERCSFACFRCGAANPVAPATTTVICDSCGGVWEVGALGYDCIEQPVSRGTKQDVPPLSRFGRDILEEDPAEGTSYGDEMNALSDYYFSLAIDRPDSPPL